MPEETTEVKTESQEQSAQNTNSQVVKSPLPEEGAAIVSDQLPGEKKPEPTQENDEEEIDFVEFANDQKPEEAKKITDYFKDLDDDIDTEEKFVERAKEYKKKANEFRTIAESETIIKDDPYISNWSQHIEAEDETLVLSAVTAKFKEKGLSEKDAAAKAQARIDGWKENSPSRIAEEAEDLRLELSGLINTRKSQLQQHIAETKKALTLSDKLDPAHLDKTIETLSKTDNFLGLKIGGKSEQSKKEFLKPVIEAIKNGSALKELQSDPKLLAEFALFRQYKSQFKKAVEQRVGNTKRKVLETLKDAPHSNGSQSPRPVDRKVVESGIKDVKGFLGK